MTRTAGSSEKYTDRGIFEMDVYSSDEAFLKDYHSLIKEYQNKAGRYIKNLRRLQRAEQGLDKKLHLLNIPSVPSGDTEIRCNFCGKPKDEVFRLIAADGRDNTVYICDKCARLCNEIIDEEMASEADNPSGDLV